jgi:hypothetical protein
MNKEWEILSDLLCEIVASSGVYSDETSTKLGRLLVYINGKKSRKSLKSAKNLLKKSKKSSKRRGVRK